MQKKKIVNMFILTNEIKHKMYFETFLIQTLMYVKGHIYLLKIVILTVIGHLVVPSQENCMKGLKISSEI